MKKLSELFSVEWRISDPTSLILGILGKLEGVRASKKNICGPCEIDENGWVTVKLLKGLNLIVDLFGFSWVLGSDSFNGRDNKMAMIVCASNSREIQAPGTQTEEGFRFYLLRSFYRIVAEYSCVDGKPVAEWRILSARFDAATKKGNTIRVVAEQYRLDMPAELGKRYLMAYCEEPFPTRENMVCAIKAYIQGEKAIPDVWKTRLVQLAEAMAVTYARTFDMPAGLPTWEVQAEAKPEPATESNVLELKVEPTQPDEEEPEEKKRVAIGGGDPAEGQRITELQAKAQNPGGKEGRGHRKPAKTSQNKGKGGNKLSM